mmetsp:Transcript_19982/g.30353  ORF Transcript_19982/g.30353 Transcript_19982/m.30353 type:complete len:279 (-) Transcript_19982:574-1410(-)
MVDPQLINSIEKYPIYLPREHLVDKALYFMVATAIVLTIVYQVMFLLTRRHIKTDDILLLKTSGYQATNLLMNFVLGISGIIVFFGYLPNETTAEERMTGFTELYPFACLIMGYQLWSIPMGIFVVKEKPVMIFHHLAVCIVGCCSAFFVIGYRYHNPFFYGAVELSSVPLAIMNFLKGNDEVRALYPKVFSTSRLTFGVLFLILRVYLWIPQMYDFLYLTYVTHEACQTAFCYFGAYSCAFSGSSLTCLQLFWACKIVEGLWKGASPKQKSKKDKHP